MWHDRMERDTLIVTHEFRPYCWAFGDPGSPMPLHVLEGKGLIRTTRSRVHIRDRSGLQLAANGFLRHAGSRVRPSYAVRPRTTPHRTRFITAGLRGQAEYAKKKRQHQKTFHIAREAEA